MELGQKKQTTKEYYDKIAPEWARARDNLEYLKVEFLEFQKLLPRGRILDVGCGTGRDSNLFMKNGYEYIGIDISEGMLSEARKMFPDADFRQMDLMKLDFPDDCFDGIWSFAAYLHIPKNEIDNSIKEASRILKAGGIGFIAIKKGSKEGYLDSENGKRYFFFTGRINLQKLSKITVLKYLNFGKIRGFIIRQKT